MPIDTGFYQGEKMNEEKYIIEMSEEEMWAVVTALFEYNRNPISENHGKLALDVYNRIKEMALVRISQHLSEANGKRAAGLE